MTQLQMPKVDTEVLNNKQVYISDLKKILKKKENVLSLWTIRPYETDALTACRRYISGGFT